MLCWKNHAKKGKKSASGDDEEPMESETIKNQSLLKQYKISTFLSPLHRETKWDNLSFLLASVCSVEEKFEGILRHCFHDTANAVCLYRIVSTPATQPARQVSSKEYANYTRQT